MENENKEKEYTAVERLKILERAEYEKLRILDRSKYIRTVKDEEDLTDEDIYVPVTKKGKTVYIVAVKD